MKLHPFNLSRRIIAHKYRKGRFEEVIRDCGKFLARHPGDVTVLELNARAHISMRNWEMGWKYYRQVFSINPDYRDVCKQLARCSIYTKKWDSLNRISDHDPAVLTDMSIQRALGKKLLTLPTVDFVEFSALQRIHKAIPETALNRWVALNELERPEELLPIDRFCLDNLIGGTYLGQMLSRILQRSKSEARNTLHIFTKSHEISVIAGWITSSVHLNREHAELIASWLISYINPKEMSLQTLEAICMSEEIPPHMAEVVKVYLHNCSEEEIKRAIRVIGKKSDPRNFVSEDLIIQMLEDEIEPDKNNPRVYTWMIEHCLRTDRSHLIEKMLRNSPLSIASPITNTLRNLTRNRFDGRLCELLEVILEEKSMLEEIKMRHEIAKALLSSFEPMLALAFAHECIQLEPQDAVCGLYLLNAAIMTGSPTTILQAADIALSMKHRSAKIDYASVAVAALRVNDIEYAQNLLVENRLAADVRSQRIRIGIAFHIYQDYNMAIKEIENTQNKHLSDPTIKLYHSLSLIYLERYEEAITYVRSNITDKTEMALLLHIVHRRSGEHDLAKTTLNTLMTSQKRTEIPQSFFTDNYSFTSLGVESLENSNPLHPKRLVSVIMTVHKWNDAFPLAVNSILNQSHENIELIVVDDFSPLDDVEKYDLLLTDPRIKRIRMRENSGTYASRNSGLEVASGEFVTFADSDDWNHPDRILNSINLIEEKNVDVVMGRFIRVDNDGRIQFNGSKISQFCLVGVFIRRKVMIDKQLLFDGRARFSADSEFFERLRLLLGEHRIHRHDGIDIFALHHDDSLTGGGENAIGWMGPGETRLRYVSGYRRAHAKLKHGYDFNFKDFPSPSNLQVPVTENTHNMKLRQLLGLEIIKESPTKEIHSDDTVIVFMATYPGGFKTVGNAIKSILNQSRKVDKIVLHVNSDSPPKDLPEDNRVDVRLSLENHADNGKFKYMKEFEGYFFTVDDDISYPPDYVERLIQYVDHFGKSSIIGVHGAVFPVGPPVSRWAEYRELRRTHTFTTANASFTKVNCLGTGTIAFHSQIGIPNFEEFDTLRMVDLHIAVWAQKNNIRMYSCPRRKNWLTEFDIDHEQRIWSQANTQKELQAEMILTLNKVNPWSDLNQFCKTLERGPLAAARESKSRQIPFGMELSKHQMWPEIPDNPKVTIYIPAFNTEKYILDCVNSALNQTYKNIEVSIQNGGSSDNTLSIIESNFSHLKNVIISSQPTTLGEGTNIAIQQGSGELILQLDSDDILHPHAAERLVEAIGKQNVCSYGNFSRIDENGETIDSGWEEPLYTRERLTRSMIIHHPRMFRRDAWELVGGHDEKLRNAEDYDFFLKLSEKGNMVHVRESLYSYRILEGSASNFSSDVLTSNTHLVQKRMLERNKLNYELIIPNSEYPRNVHYRHIAYSEIGTND